jgi:hypothetical protein
MPERIQRRRTKGFRMPPGAIYVGRPTRWGNPYTVGHLCPLIWTWHDQHWTCQPHGTDRVRDRAHAVDLYRRIAHQPAFIADVRRHLAGHDLACWCPANQPCHADVLLEIANGGAP